MTAISNVSGHARDFQKSIHSSIDFSHVFFREQKSKIQKENYNIYVYARRNLLFQHDIPRRKRKQRAFQETFRLSLSWSAENNILETKDWSWKLDCPSKAPWVSCVGTRNDSFNTTSVKRSTILYRKEQTINRNENLHASVGGFSRVDFARYRLKCIPAIWIIHCFLSDSHRIIVQVLCA